MDELVLSKRPVARDIEKNEGVEDCVEELAENLFDLLQGILAVGNLSISHHKPINPLILCSCTLLLKYSYHSGNLLVHRGNIPLLVLLLLLQHIRASCQHAMDDLAHSQPPHVSTWPSS